MALVRVLKQGMRGKDVEAHKRAVAKYLHTGGLTNFMNKPVAIRRYYGPFFTRNVKLVQKSELLPKTGIIDKRLHDILWNEGYFDAYAKRLNSEAQAEFTPVPILVEPTQGWDSLDRSLWALYSSGRRRGFSDQGTYNPNSTLPSGRPSDHAVYPAKAFDLGFTPATGYSNLAARVYFNDCTKDPTVKYVILGNKIWSEARGLHAYTGGGHDSHVHVSGK